MNRRFTDRSTYAKCPVHNAIYIEAALRIEQRAYFSKAEVVKAGGFGAVADSINWDYIKEMFLQRSDRIDLVPLSKDFFKKPHTPEERERREIELRSTSRLIAIGKATYGYASADSRGDGKFLAFRHAKYKAAVNNGVTKAFTAYRDAVSAKLGHDVLAEPETPEAPALEGPEKDEEAA